MVLLEPVSAPPLRCGERGPRITALRALLVRAGMELPLPPAWIDPDLIDPELFDPGLEQVVRAFQQHRGLVADGVVGPATARALDGARWRLGDRILMYTAGHLMRGDDVAALQERLVVLGLLAGPVDGLFGPRTEAALRELQRGVGLEPDGLCGPGTLRAIDALAQAVGGGDPWALRQQAAVAVAGVSLASKVIVLDPARGGDDPGVIGWGGLTEAEVTFDLASRVERRLAATGATPVLTRGVGSNPPDVERAELAASVGADVLLSLHCDGHPSPDARGIATFYWGDARIGARSATGQQLASLVQRELVVRSGMPDLRTHACTFDIIRITKMPAVLVELGYLTNPEDAARLGNPRFRDEVAEALVVAIQRLYLGDEDAETGTLQLRDVLAHAGRMG